MVIWRDIPVRIRIKQVHIKKIGGKVYNSFCNDFGDIPVLNFNEVTNKVEAVENRRGRAYAARKRTCYRSRIQDRRLKVRASD